MKLEAKHLKAVLLAVAKKDIREYLNDLYIDTVHAARDENPTVFVVGTDGHRLHYVRVPLQAPATDLPATGLILGVENVKAALKACKGDTLTLTYVNKHLVSLTVPLDKYGATTADMPVSLDYRTYPDWRRVLPTAPTLAEVAGKRERIPNINPYYLSDAAQGVAKALGHKLNPNVFITPTETSYLITHEGAPEFGAIIMSTRTTGNQSPDMPATN